MSAADFTVENHGSIFLLRSHSANGDEWISAHIPDDAQTLGTAIAVEHRFIEDIVSGIRDDGLVVA